MRKFTCVLLALLLLFTAATPVFAAEPGLQNFGVQTIYTGFSDVSDSDWYAESMQTVCEYGLMKEKTRKNFLHPEISRSRKRWPPPAACTISITAEAANLNRRSHGIRSTSTHGGHLRTMDFILKAPPSGPVRSQESCLRMSLRRRFRARHMPRSIRSCLEISRT